MRRSNRFAGGVLSSLVLAASVASANPAPCPEDFGVQADGQSVSFRCHGISAYGDYDCGATVYRSRKPITYQDPGLVEVPLDWTKADCTPPGPETDSGPGQAFCSFKATEPCVPAGAWYYRHSGVHQCGMVPPADPVVTVPDVGQDCVVSTADAQAEVVGESEPASALEPANPSDSASVASEANGGDVGTASSSGRGCGAFPAGDAVIPLLLTIGWGVARRRR